MKITDIQTYQLSGPELEAPLAPAWAPGTEWRRWGGTVVKVFTDEGLVGLGSPGYAASPVIESWLKPQLLGQDPFALERHAPLFRNANAAWGLEIALWDIIGKACGQPLYKLWGGFRDRVPAYASFIEVRTPQRRAEDVAARRAEGWRAVKLRLHEYRWLIERDCYDVLQPEAMVGETMTQIRKACALAELHHKLCAPHHGGGGLGFVAHLHLCAAIPNCPFVEVFHDTPGLSSDAFQWYLAAPLRLDPADGCLPVPQRPGLGVELDEDKLRRYGAHP